MNVFFFTNNERISSITEVMCICYSGSDLLNLIGMFIYIKIFSVYSKHVFNISIIQGLLGMRICFSGKTEDSEAAPVTHRAKYVPGTKMFCLTG
jgi:hypothetical protein